MIMLFLPDQEHLVLPMLVQLVPCNEHWTLSVGSNHQNYYLLFHWVFETLVSISEYSYLYCDTKIMTQGQD